MNSSSMESGIAGEPSFTRRASTQAESSPGQRGIKASIFGPSLFMNVLYDYKSVLLYFRLDKYVYLFINMLMARNRLAEEWFTLKNRSSCIASDDQKIVISILAQKYNILHVLESAGVKKIEGEKLTVQQLTLDLQKSLLELRLM